ncbi:MAG: WYL domain-containing protein [Clostridia bacterium]|nr:WYL domain-containing protein [Clostridia bacterium]
MAKEKKKLLILAVMEILRKETDFTHTLRQAAIIERLNRDFNLTCTRKSVRQNLGDLQDAGYPVKFNHGWYYDHEFSPAELDYLLDCALSGGHMSDEERSSLVSRLKALGGDCYKAVADVQRRRPATSQFLSNTAVLRRAIAEGKQVTFRYGDWDVDKELHPRKAPNGRAKNYRVNPYYIVGTNGRTYLICNVDKHEDLCHFRVDRIMNAEVAARSAKDITSVTGEAPDLSEYLCNHPYMYSGETQTFRLRVDRSAINDVLDWFGTDLEFSKVTETTAECEVQSDPVSMDFWLRRYGEHAVLV